MTRDPSAHAFLALGNLCFVIATGSRVKTQDSSKIAVQGHGEEDEPCPPSAYWTLVGEQRQDKIGGSAQS